MAITLITRGRSSGSGIEPITSGFHSVSSETPDVVASITPTSTVSLSLKNRRGSHPFRSSDQLKQDVEDVLVLMMKGGYHSVEQGQKIQIQGLDNTILDFSYPDWEQILKVIIRPEIVQVVERGDLSIAQKLDLIRPSLVTVLDEIEI